MGDIPNNEQAPESPPGGKAKPKPGELVAHFKAFVSDWPFLGTTAVVLCGALGTYFTNLPIAPYVLAGGLVGVVFVCAHKLFGSRDWLKSYLVPIFLGVVIFAGVHWMVKASKSETASDDINGTSFTHKQISELFPFGYGVIFLKENGPFEFDERRSETNQLLNWEVDFKNITVTRDVAAQTVEFVIPARAEGRNFNLTAGTNALPRIWIRSKLKPGVVALGPVNSRNQPALMVFTASDNQRYPVFAVGYRIATDEELRRSGIKPEQAPVEAIELKQQIRTLMESINPNVLGRIDAGQTQIPVLIGAINQAKLAEISQRGGFGAYLSFRKVGTTAGGQTFVSGFLNDDDVGMRQGFILMPKDAIRR